MYRNDNNTGVAESEFVFGNPGDSLMAGDWDSDGDDTVAVYRPRNGVLYVKNANNAGQADFAVDVGFLQDVVPLAR